MNLIMSQYWTTLKSSVVWQAAKMTGLIRGHQAPPLIWNTIRRRNLRASYCQPRPQLEVELMLDVLCPPVFYHENKKKSISVDYSKEEKNNNNNDEQRQQEQQQQHKQKKTRKTKQNRRIVSSFICHYLLRSIQQL